MARPRKCWSIRVGERGHQVVAYERKLGGPLRLRWWVPARAGGAGRRAYHALHHSDREAATRAARAVAANLLAATVTAQSGGATLAEVFAAYTRDVCDHTKGDGAKEARRRTILWLSYLGATRDARTIDFPTIDRFIRERRVGAVHAPASRLSAAPSDRAIGADIVHLKAALNHATKVMRAGTTDRLLLDNPLRGFAVPKNKNPKHPVATYDRFEKVMTKADPADRQRLFGAFMMLIEGLGWRVSAVCGLRACDIDRRTDARAPYGRIYKNPALDKEGVGRWLPMSESIRQGVDRALGANPAIGEWPLFPAPRARTEVERGVVPKPWSRHHARKLLVRAERLAGLSPLDGSDFHAYRRAWATARKHHPPQDVASVGGWKDLGTLQRIYQQSDDETMLAVINEPRKVRDVEPSSEASAG